MRADGMSERQIADETKIPKSTVHRIISTAPFGAVELPSVVVGKDGKQRQAVQPDRKAPEPDLGLQVEKSHMYEPAQRPISITVAKPEQVVRVAAQAQSVINLESAPEKSDRQLAKAIGVNHETVGAQRKELEESGGIRHFLARQDPRTGRLSQPASKPISITVAKPEQVVRVAAQAQSVINLESAPEKSDRQLAKAIGVSNKTVSTARNELVADGELCKLHTSTGKDGKEYPRQVSALKKQCCRYSTD